MGGRAGRASPLGPGPGAWAPARPPQHGLAEEAGRGGPRSSPSSWEQVGQSRVRASGLLPTHRPGALRHLPCSPVTVSGTEGQSVRCSFWSRRFKPCVALFPVPGTRDAMTDGKQPGLHRPASAGAHSCRTGCRGHCWADPSPPQPAPQQLQGRFIAGVHVFFVNLSVLD